MSSSQYFISTGQKDYQRLSTVNRLYNPGTIQFLKRRGIKPGMKVLEIGCGTGHMACELAKLIGPKGRVFASDLYDEQLAIAKETAATKNISNITFMKLDLNQQLQDYQEQFDFIFGRWVLEFTHDPHQTLISLFSCLRPGGTLVYEGSDIRNPGCFSYPYNPVIELYCQYGIKICELNGMQLDFIKKVYFHLKQCQPTSLTTAINHPMMHTPDEKMLFRMVFESSQSFILQQNLLSQSAYDELINKLTQFELEDNIAGYYQNLMVAATK